MLDSLLKNKFYRKCNSGMKMTKTRIEIIKRKRNAMQKYLQNDVADLLKDGLDIDAYFRAEGLLVELNLLSCYDLADKFCDHILEYLSVMSKQRECPEECKEAVSSLIFAAARFADLPELREMRSTFTERYGNTLDCYVSKEFVEKSKSMTPTKDATIELMQHIATEAEVHWDSKATEEKLYNPLGQARNNVGDKYQASETPKDGKQSYLSRNNGKIKSLKAIQEDNTCTKDLEQETAPQTSSHVAVEEFADKKAFNYDPAPPYTKSRIHDHGDNNEGKIRPDPINYGNIGIFEGGSTTSTAGREKSGRGEKRKELARLADLNEDQQDGGDRWLDRLLTFYRRKRNKLYNTIGNTESTKSQPKQDIYSRVTRRGASWDFPSTRTALSLPSEQKIESEGIKGHVRSTSLPPEMPKGGHVHPKLPDDYDDFLAHLASIRNEGN